jgi:hypothetical protein
MTRTIPTLRTPDRLGRLLSLLETLYAEGLDERALPFGVPFDPPLIDTLRNPGLSLAETWDATDAWMYRVRWWGIPMAVIENAPVSEGAKPFRQRIETWRQQEGI